ncbi:hypothetical protein FKP32DRAFT_1674001 [Trametes sanguinea]|nr:hypothetical protein FKP32DRAFT_1674001 [Trametes sanguinea]
MVSPYAPPGESPADLWLERSNLVGAVLGGVAYGIHVAVFAECLYRIPPWPKSSRRRDPSRSWFLFAYVFVLFLMGTLNLAGNTKMTQLMFIDNRAYPGGPSAWFFDNYDNPNNTAGNASYIIANFFADGLLLWRTYRVWNSIWIILFPFIVFLGSTAMSIMTLFQSSRPDASLWTKTTVQFSLPYFSISIALNIMLTLLLVARLFYMSWSAGKALSKEHGRPYISIAAMLLESATPYAVVGLIFIISYARNSNVQNLVLPILSQIMCISPEIIILRVAMGRATDSKPRSNETTMQFGSRSGYHSSYATSYATSAYPTSSYPSTEMELKSTGLSMGSTMLGSQPELPKAIV